MLIVLVSSGDLTAIGEPAGTASVPLYLSKSKEAKGWSRPRLEKGL
jgi:hypothetical protein